MLKMKKRLRGTPRLKKSSARARERVLRAIAGVVNDLRQPVGLHQQSDEVQVLGGDEDLATFSKGTLKKSRGARINPPTRAP